MSITKELREHAGEMAPQWEMGTLLAIADRIDAEHEAALLNVHTDLMDARGWVRLPVDADGEYIHVGDKLDGYGKTIEVVELRYGRSGWVLISRDGNAYADTFAFAHHHAPTVEDVLREFVTEFNRDDTELCDEEIIERFSKRLRLREDA